MVTDYLGVTRKLEKQATVTSMTTKLHPIVHEIFLLKSRQLKSITFIKVESHQNDVK